MIGRSKDRQLLSSCCGEAGKGTQQPAYAYRLVPKPSESALKEYEAFRCLADDDAARESCYEAGGITTRL